MGGLLVRGLGARRQRFVAARQNAVGTVADGENVVVARCLELIVYDEAIDAVRFEGVEPLEELRSLDAGRPHDEFGGKERSIGKPNAMGGGLSDSDSATNIDPEVAQQLFGRVRKMLRQGR